MSHPILEGLASPDPSERRLACRDAARDPSASLFLDALLEALGDPVRGVAKAASEALVGLGSHERGLAAALRRAARSECPARRFHAAVTLAQLEPPDPGLLPVFVEALGSPEGDLRWSAARWLVAMGRAHPEVLALCLGLVRSDERPGARRMATFALRELAPDLPESAIALLEATRDESLPVRRAALMALAALMDPPRRVVDRLVETLDEDDDAASRRIAALALAELACADPGAVPAEALEALRRAGDSPVDPELRETAREAWERIQARESR
jgi:HEAT repeat protein